MAHIIVVVVVVVVLGVLVVDDDDDDLASRGAWRSSRAIWVGALVLVWSV